MAQQFAPVCSMAGAYNGNHAHSTGNQSGIEFKKIGWWFRILGFWDFGILRFCDFIFYLEFLYYLQFDFYLEFVFCDLEFSERC